MTEEDLPAPVVVADREHHRFLVEQGGAVAELTYELEGQRLLLVHTGVPSSLEGRGIGGTLVRAAIDWALEQGLTVVPLCPYVRRWLRRHPDVAAQLKLEWD